MNYADEILITGPGHLEPPGSAGPRGQKKKNAEKMMLHLSFFYELLHYTGNWLNISNEWDT